MLLQDTSQEGWTTDEELLPARVVSPRRILISELDAPNWTQRDLAHIMGRPYQAVNEIINGTKQITPDTALDLSQVFGTSPEFWANLEANHRAFLAKQKRDRDAKRTACRPSCT